MPAASGTTALPYAEPSAFRIAANPETARTCPVFADGGESAIKTLIILVIVLFFFFVFILLDIFLLYLCSFERIEQ